jgi:hypothetical protein
MAKKSTKQQSVTTYQGFAFVEQYSALDVLMPCYYAYFGPNSAVLLIYGLFVRQLPYIGMVWANGGKWRGIVRDLGVLGLFGAITR